MLGVPLLMTSGITASWPPSASFERSGPYLAAEVICSFTWQTRQDWLKRSRPRNWVASRVLGSGKGCPDAAPTAANSMIDPIPAPNLIVFPPLAYWYFSGCYAGAEGKQR